jgi:hypothetical protein
LALALAGRSRAALLPKQVTLYRAFIRSAFAPG